MKDQPYCLIINASDISGVYDLSGISPVDDLSPVPVVVENHVGSCEPIDFDKITDINTRCSTTPFRWQYPSEPVDGLEVIIHMARAND